MGLHIDVSYDAEFVELMERLRGSYPDELFEIDGIGSQLDIHQSSKTFFNSSNANRPTADHSVDANANVSGRDVITYNYEVPKPLMKLNSYYNLWKTLKELRGKDYADFVITLQISGDIYINDVWDIGRPYCFNYSTYDIALEGLKMGSRLNITPAKSLASFLRQIEQFTVYAANSTLGATGLADVLITASWYVDRIKETGRDHKFMVGQGNPDHPDFEGQMEMYVYELLTSLIYTLNWEFRGNQSPFTNVSLYDHFFLKELAPHYLINGEAPSISTIEQVQRLFLEAYHDTLRRDPITFPVLTACFSLDDERNIKDGIFLRRIAEANREFGAINIYCGKTSTLSSCCRLRSNIDDLGYSNTFGAGGTKIGSLGVVTLNLYRMAREVIQSDLTDEDFFEDLRLAVETAAMINHAKRLFIKERIERGSLPLYTLGLMDLSRQFSTCGLTGIYEATSTLGLDVMDQDGRAFIRRLLDTVNEVNAEMTKRLGYPHNMEQVPAETSSVKLAKKDMVLGFNDGTIPFYSNQFIPLTHPADMLDRIALQGEFDEHCTGGAICHLNVAQQIDDPRTIEALIRHCAQCGVVYWAMNYALGYCAHGHGMHVVRNDTAPTCPVCRQQMDTFTRVVGFLTNTKHWNKARREHDWPSRQFYGA